MENFKFKTPLSETVFRQKYANGPNDTWPNLCRRLVNDVCGDRSLCAKPDTTPMMSKDEIGQLTQYIIDMKFIPAGRYLYYAGKSASYWNNCLALIGEEDTREEWARFAGNGTQALMTGAGIGACYDVFRPEGFPICRTGGTASGPIPLMHIMNEIGRNVIQGGSRRSALYASLNWKHEDILKFLYVKDWSDEVKALRARDFNFPATLDMTNISINWDTDFITSIDNDKPLPKIWTESVIQMCKTSEPGHSYNFYHNENDKGRNACSELTTEYDSDICNLGSVNFGAIESIEELRDVCYLAAKFLVCGTVRADLPYDKVRQVREAHRKIGLGMMGVHEWLLKRGMPYEVTSELSAWLQAWKDWTAIGANDQCDRFYISRCEKYNAIAPAGSIGILAATTTGIEPLFSVAYKRRYLGKNNKWNYQYVIDGTALRLIEEYGLNPDNIETAHTLATSPENRIKFQYDIQKHVDMAISSTINLPEWGSDLNNEDTAKDLAVLLAKYCHGLRGVTCYADGSRGGQPLTVVPYEEAKKHHGIVYSEEETCKGGICGI